MMLRKKDIVDSPTPDFENESFSVIKIFDRGRNMLFTAKPGARPNNY